MARTMKRIALISVILTPLFFLLQQRFGFLEPLTITCATTAYHLLMRFAVGGAVNVVMKNRADCSRRWYRLLPFEEKLYRKLGIRRFKDRLPTYDPTLFSLQLHNPLEIAQAMCQAEVVHEIIVPLSFLPLAAAPRLGALPVFLLTSLAAALFDLTFVILQRYNRPRMMRLIEQKKKL